MTDLLPIVLPAWLTPQLMASALVIAIVLHVAGRREQWHLA